MRRKTLAAHLALMMGAFLNPQASKSAQSMLGEYLDPFEIPRALCQVFIKNSRGHLQSCTADLISPTLLLTAAHCGRNWETGLVSCPGDEVRQIRNIQNHPQYSPLRDGTEVKGGPIQSVKNDLAILVVDRPFEVEPMRLPASEAETQTLLKTPDCAVMGYGDRKGPMSEPKGVPFQRVREDLGPGFLGSSENLSEPGDSGGGLYCKNASGKWIRIATNVFGNELFGIMPTASFHEILTDQHLQWIKARIGDLEATAGTISPDIAVERDRVESGCRALQNCFSEITQLFGATQEILNALATKFSYDEIRDQIKKLPELEGEPLLSTVIRTRDRLEDYVHRCFGFLRKLRRPQVGSVHNVNGAWMKELHPKPSSFERFTVRYLGEETTLKGVQARVQILDSYDPTRPTKRTRHQNQETTVPLSLLMASKNERPLK